MNVVQKQTFESEFLDNYLKVGLGGLSKKDTEALVMYLLDKYGLVDGSPLTSNSNQQVSALLRTPVNKVKLLRYEAGLKYGGNIEDQAKARLLAALSSASFEIRTNKICLIIEDTLAKNWLQGQLKLNNKIFDHSFNSEIIKVESDAFFVVLGKLFGSQLIIEFKKAFDNAKSEKDTEKRAKLIAGVTQKFTEGLAQTAGAGVMLFFKSFLPF